MKKLISIMLAVMLVLSASVTAFAATTDEVTPELESQIIEAVYKKYYENKYSGRVTLEDVYIDIFCTSNEGIVYFTEGAAGIGHTTNFIEKVVGDYYYSYTNGDQVILYVNGTVVELKEAFDEGLIDNDDLAEVDPMINSIEPIIGESGLDSKIEWKVKRTICDLFLGNDYIYNYEVIQSIQVHYYGETSDGGMYVSFSVPGFEFSNEMTNYILGDYVYNVEADKQVYYCTRGRYGVSIDEFCTIKEAYDTGLINDEILSEIATLNFGLMHKNDVLCGDVDGDGVITITDATMIQKMGIGMLEVNPFGDVNGDGRVSIMDVTLVQKYIAELGYNTGNVGQPATI